MSHNFEKKSRQQELFDDEDPSGALDIFRTSCGRPRANFNTPAASTSWEFDTWRHGGGHHHSAGCCQVRKLRQDLLHRLLSEQPDRRNGD
jgi:hypothetical protein